MTNIKKLHIFAFASHGKGLSGGDRIFIELSRRWSDKFPIRIHTWEEGREMCMRQNLESISVKYSISKIYLSRPFLANYLERIIKGVQVGLSLNVENKKTVFLYSASEFWMDVFPSFLIKLRYPNVRWVATWFQTAPNPLKGFSDGDRKNKYQFNAFLYWVSQLAIKPLVAKFADFVLVNNELERKQFAKLEKKGKVIVVIGAVPLEGIKIYQSRIHDHQLLSYDAVFQGRFHAQKGVVELVEIWEKVVKKKPRAKLAMIGDGPLMKNVKFKIKDLKLKNNIKLFSYVFDGEKKYKIFSQSKIVVHPAFYDSGGMASAEAMAFGIPAVGFNLDAYKSYYPHGMVKVKIGDLDAFSEAILLLLQDNKKRLDLGKLARKMIETDWSWEKRAKEILQSIS